MRGEAFRQEIPLPSCENLAPGSTKGQVGPQEQALRRSQMCHDLRPACTDAGTDDTVCVSVGALSELKAKHGHKTKDCHPRKGLVLSDLKDNHHRVLLSEEQVERRRVQHDQRCW
jgi:hypothetical protein